MDENNALAKPSTAFNMSSINLADYKDYVVVAQTGVTVTPYPFERLKFEQGRNTRFAILTDEVLVLKRHYTAELGYFLCNGGECCRLTEKSPSVVYIYPVVQYIDCSDKGKPLSDKIQVRLLQCNKDMYTYLTSIKEVKGDLTQFDFLGTKIPGSEKFQKTQLMEAGPSLWKNNDKSILYVTDYMRQNEDRLLSSVGKIYTDEKLRELLGEANAITEVSEQDVDDIFRT